MCVWDRKKGDDKETEMYVRAYRMSVYMCMCVLNREYTGALHVILLPAYKYHLQVSLIITWMTRQFTEFQTNIVSVERMKEYSELKTEVN